MEDKNSELLFEYLRSILYDKKIQPLDVEQLDEPFRKLGRGLQYFAKTFTETKQYAAALSRGNLSVQPPPRENFLCENLKNIHANLNHLTWQAKQVAKGDYSQTVSYLGEFSEAFNTMTQQLKERELKLKQEAEREKIHAGMVETYNQLLVEMIDRSEEEIFVTSADGRRILYCKRGMTEVLTGMKFTRCVFGSHRNTGRKRAEILLNGYGKQRIQDIIFIGSLPDICSGRGNRPFFILSGM